MTHNLIWDRETPQDAIWKCVDCGRVIGFNKEGIPGNGTPAASFIGGAWVRPADDPDTWMGECDAQS